MATHIPENGPIASTEVHWSSISEMLADTLAHREITVCGPNLRVLMGCIGHPGKISEDLTVAPAVMAAVNEFRQNLAGRPRATVEQVRRKRHRRQAFGHAMSADRFLRMDPNGWDRVRRVPQPVRRIHLGVNVGAIAGRGPEHTLHRGAAIVALAEWLMAEGYQVKVTSYWHSVKVDGGSCNSLAVCVVKDWAGVLNTSAIVKVCTDVEFVRPLMLAARARWAGFGITTGMGCTKDISEEQAKAMGLDVFAPSSIMSKREAQRWFDQAKAQILAG